MNSERSDERQRAYEAAFHVIYNCLQIGLRGGIAKPPPEALRALDELAHKLVIRGPIDEQGN